MTENPHTRYNTLDTKSGRGHLQGISKPGGLKNTERNHGSFVFSLWAKTCFPSHTLTCSLTNAHAWTQIHYKASAIKNRGELYVTVSFYFDNRCLPLPSFMVSGIPAKNKGWLLKKKRPRRYWWKELTVGGDGRRVRCVCKVGEGGATSLASQGQEQCPLARSAVRNGSVSQKPPSPPWTCQFGGDN